MIHGSFTAIARALQYVAAAADGATLAAEASLAEASLAGLQAYATLRYSPGAALLNGAAAHAVYCMPRFKPQEVRHERFAILRSNCHDDTQVCVHRNSWQRRTDSLVNSGPWSHHPAWLAEQRLCCAVGSVADRSLRPAQVANTLWSYATLAHDPGSQLLDAIAAHMCDRMHVFRPQAISNSLWVRRYTTPVCFQHSSSSGLVVHQRQSVPTVLAAAVWRPVHAYSTPANAQGKRTTRLVCCGLRRTPSCSTTRGGSCWRLPAGAPWPRCTSTPRRWGARTDGCTDC